MGRLLAAGYAGAGGGDPQAFALLRTQNSAIFADGFERGTVGGWPGHRPSQKIGRKIGWHFHPGGWHFSPSTSPHQRTPLSHPPPEFRSPPQRPT